VAAIFAVLLIALSKINGIVARRLRVQAPAYIVVGERLLACPPFRAEDRPHIVKETVP
jgi:hypothetical protein